MCHDICKGIRGWFRSFTKLEILLSLLEALQLVLLIALLTFVVLHLIVCLQATHYDAETSIIKSPEYGIPTPVNVASPAGGARNVTEDPVQCTWNPSYKTEAVTHYYLNKENEAEATVATETIDKYTKEKNLFNFNRVLLPENPDGLEDNSNLNDFVAALVEIKYSSEPVFGCISTVINDYWTITAASCIGSLHMRELDDIGIMPGYDEDDNDIFNVTAIIIHPNYDRLNNSNNYDLAAVKTVDSLTENGKAVLKLPNPVDLFITTIGEGLTIIGFGKYRNVESDKHERKVHEVFMHVLPWGHCEQNDTSAGLSSGKDVALSKNRGDVIQRMCAGTVTTREGRRCRYCAGTPLLRQRTLLAMMVDRHQCALGCRPAQYVSLSQHVLWLRSLDSSI